MRHKGIFFALFHNELEKLWAHRAYVLIVAFLIIVVGSSFLVYRSHQLSLQQAQTNMQQMEHQMGQLRQQERHASGQSKVEVRQALAADQQTLQQMKMQGPIINLKQETQQLRAQLKHVPSSQQGSILEQLAVAKGALKKGITQENSLTGLGLAGALFAGGTMLLFGLMTVGLTSDRFSSELEGGTWGVLLLHSPRRVPIFWAKLSASVVLLWAFMLSTALAILGVTGLLVGFGAPRFPVEVGMRLAAPTQPTLPVSIPPQSFHFISLLTYDVWALLLAMLSVSVLGAICVAVSLLTRSSVLSLIVGAVLVLSEVFAQIAAHWAGWIALVDPAVHLPLVADWTGSLAQSFNLADLTMKSGLTVLLAWGVIAVVAGMWAVRRIDL